MTDRPNGQLPDGALVRTAREPGQAAYETRFEMHRPFMDWATLSEKWKNEWRLVEAAVLAEHSTPVLETLNAEIDRLRKLLARRDSQLAAAGVPCPEIPEGVLPPGVLQAYSDAHRNYPEQSRHLQAHTAGLRAALMVDRAQRVPRTSPEAQGQASKTLELADRLRAWSENDPDQDYFFGGDGDVFSAMQLDCADASTAILATIAWHAKQPPFRLDPHWTGACLGFAGGSLNLKIPEGSAEFVFAEDELELVEEEGRTLFIARLSASQVRAVHRHLAAYLVAPAPEDPSPIIASPQEA